MITIIEKLTSASKSADRFGSEEVVSLRYAKELIEESFIDGVRASVNYLRKRGDVCNCADALDAIRTELKIYAKVSGLDRSARS